MEGKTWYPGIAGLVLGAVAIPFFAHFGEMQYYRPVMVAVVATTLAALMRRQSYRQIWFWSILLFAAALQTGAILLIPWGTRWVPAAVLTPYCVVDLLMILAMLDLAKRLKKTTDRHTDNEDHSFHHKVP